MSKTFDEGGAKGLLLANLGVGCSGCNIVFDSTLDNEDVTAASLTMDDEVHGFNKDEVQQNIEGVPPSVNTTTNSNYAVDVTSLIGKLESLLSNATGNYSTIENMPLVPQLASLRNQYAELGKDGFVQEVGISVRIAKYKKKKNSSVERKTLNFSSPLSHFFGSFSQNVMPVLSKMRLRPTNLFITRQLNVVESP
jgi:hypothetical protein